MSREESLLSLSHAALQHIRRAFAHTHSPGLATYPEAHAILSRYTSTRAIDAALRRIDVNRTQTISFSQLADFFIAGQESLDLVSAEEGALETFTHRFTQPIHWSSIHRSAVHVLAFATRPRPLLVSGGRDGQVALWDPDTLRCVTKVSRMRTFVPIWVDAHRGHGCCYSHHTS